MMMMMIESLDILVGIRYALRYLLVVVIILLIVLPKSIKMGIFSEFLLEVNSFYHNNSIFHRLGRLLGITITITITITIAITIGIGIGITIG